MTFRMPLDLAPIAGQQEARLLRLRGRFRFGGTLALLVGASAFNPVPEVLVSRAANKRLPTPQTITANLVPLNSIDGCCAAHRRRRQIRLTCDSFAITYINPKLDRDERSAAPTCGPRCPSRSPTGRAVAAAEDHQLRDGQLQNVALAQYGHCRRHAAVLADRVATREETAS